MDQQTIGGFFMQNISVYLNQRASNSSHNWQGEINQALFRSQIDYKTPSDLEELYKVLDEDIEKSVDAILSVGGDGTVHTIIQKLAGTDIGLLVVPGGTANDLAGAMGSDGNVKKISQTIRNNIKKKIDLININGRFMATNGGLGFAAEVAQEINLLRAQFPQFKKFMQFSGKNIYSMFVAKKLLNRDLKSYKFKINSAEFNDTIYSPLVLINNQPMVGGSFEVAPETNHQDGTFNVTILKHSNRLELISCFLKILSGNFPSNDPDYISFETNEIQIQLLDEEQGLKFFGDGETFEEAKNWHIKCYANFLNVYSPKDHNQHGLEGLDVQVTLT